MLRVVIDTNIWIRALLGGQATLPVLTAWQNNKFQLIVSEPLLTELEAVWQRPRFKERIKPEQAQALLEQLRWRGHIIEVMTIPPYCRDPKDQPVLATAIDGHAEVLVTGDADLRADEALRQEMAAYGVQLWGIDTFLNNLGQQENYT
jgi:putative PIN family toxin of toxin-antitoxin system